jgi:phenylpyruvate tautomerase PptA (4-oxalocrotonate tautomerase family)
MPLLSITTNQTVEQEVLHDLIKQASTIVSEMLGKPERYVMINITFNPNMSFAGTSDTLAYLELKSIGLLAERTPIFSKTLSRFMQQAFQIPAERVYIEFSAAEGGFWGWNATTF